jgi:hypothetical protein
MKTYRVRSKKYSKRRKMSKKKYYKKRNYKRKTLRKKMRGGAPPSFEKVLSEIRSKPLGGMIQIPIKLYSTRVELRPVNDEANPNYLIFRNYVANNEQLTPDDKIGAVESLDDGESSIDEDAMFDLWVSDMDTGQRLLLTKKPTLEEIVSNNTDPANTEAIKHFNIDRPLDIEFIFQKVAGEVVPAAAGAAAAPAAPAAAAAAPAAGAPAEAAAAPPP